MKAFNIILQLRSIVYPEQDMIYLVNLIRKSQSPFYRRKYEEAGIKPSDLRTLSDIGQVPFTVKEELRESQARQPPWGDFPCIPPEEGVRVFQTTGTTGVPVKVLLNREDWVKHFYEQFMHYMYGYGIKTPEVETVEMGKLPRFELKARRVIRED